MAAECPFCPFSDHDSYFLLEHVELYHPEGGQSPFIAKEAAMRLVDEDYDEEATSASDAPSEEEYIECECGESVILREFESHSELHRDEGMALDQSEKMTGDTSTPPNKMQNGHAFASSGDGLPNGAQFDARRRQRNLLEVNSVVNPRSPSQDRKQRHGFNGWRGLLLGSNSSTSRSKTAKVKHKGIRRLGVYTTEKEGKIEDG